MAHFISANNFIVIVTLTFFFCATSHIIIFWGSGKVKVCASLKCTSHITSSLFLKGLTALTGFHVALHDTTVRLSFLTGYWMNASMCCRVTSLTRMFFSYHQVEPDYLPGVRTRRRCTRVCKPLASREGELMAQFNCTPPRHSPLRFPVDGVPCLSLCVPQCSAIFILFWYIPTGPFCLGCEKC